MNTHINNAIEG